MSAVDQRKNVVAFYPLRQARYSPKATDTHLALGESRVGDSARK